MALTGTIVLFLSLYSPLVLSPVLSSTSPSRHPHPLHLVLPSPLLPLQLLTLSISPSASLLLPRPLLLLLCNFCNIYLQAKGFFIKEAWFLKYLKSIFWLFYFPYLRCLYQENLFNFKDECLFLGKPFSLKIYKYYRIYTERDGEGEREKRESGRAIKIFSIFNFAIRRHFRYPAVTINSFRSDFALFPWLGSI